jgi:pilus assembly protein CpaF
MLLAEDIRMQLSDNEISVIHSMISESLQGAMVLDDENFRRIIARCVSKGLSGTRYGLKEKSDIADGFFSRIRGYDVLQPLIDDPKITEIMVNGPSSIFYEQDGTLKRYASGFSDAKHLSDVIARIFAAENKSLSENEPIADLRLRDGSRANAVLLPIAPDGPVLTIRKFTGIRPDMDALLQCGFLSAAQADFLIHAVIHKKSIFLSGGTGTGKTTFLNVLSAYIPSTERIVTVEDSPELKLQNTPNLVRLETRPPMPDGTGEVTIAHLIRCALRMRPDRIIVGEVRGCEAADMLWAMNTGHMGSLCTGHSNSAEDMLSRLGIMVQESSNLPIGVIGALIASAIDLVVHLQRTSSGSRRIARIIEVQGYSDGDFRCMEVP